MNNRLAGWLEENRDLAFELVRIYLGLGLFAKGVHFANNIGAAMDLVNKGGLDVPGVALAHFVVVVHLGGGLLLAAGLMTRLAALLQVPVLIGAVAFVHFREGLFGPSQNLEFSALVLALLVLTAAHGGGRLSADRALSRKALEEAHA